MRTLLKAVIAATILLAFSMPASADTTCAAGSICTVQLNNANVASLAGVQVTVTINNTGSQTVISVQFTNNPLTNTPLGIDDFNYMGQIKTGTGKKAVTNPATIDPSNPSEQREIVGVNDSTDPCTSSDGFDCWRVHFGSIQAGGGFGAFASASNHSSAGIGGVSGAIVFTLDGLVTLFTSNAQGSTFAVHVRFDQNCSGWISDGTSNSPGVDPNCMTAPPPPPPPQVPEPASLVLFGTGLVGLAGIVRRRMRR